MSPNDTLEDLLGGDTAASHEPEAYAAGARDFINNTPRPNPYDATVEPMKFAAYAEGWHVASVVRLPEPVRITLPPKQASEPPKAPEGYGYADFQAGCI